MTGGSDGEESAYGAGDPVQSLGWEGPLEKGKATHSSILAWRIPWTVESTSRKESDTTEQLSLSLYGILTHPPQEKHFAEYYKMLSFQKEGKQSKDNIRK